jgi:hypothetical protein
MRAYLLGGRPIHFPFLSGILRYDCPTCDAPCCKGAHLGIGKSKELVQLSSVQPSIGLFASPGFSGSAMMSIASPQDACWFLDGKRRCRLEKVMGREAKPAGCRLFPFQRIRALGEHLAVVPDFLCPITIGDVAEAGPTSHDEITLEMHRTQVPRTGHPELPPPRDVPWADAVLLERRIVTESERFLDGGDYAAFCDVQLELTRALLGTEGKAGQMHRLEATIRRFLLVDAKPSIAATRDLVALTGSLRLMVSSLARRETPALLVALSVLVGVYENMRGAKRTPRTAVSILEQQLPLLYVLSHLGDRPTLADQASLAKLLEKLPAVRAPLLAVLEAVTVNKNATVAETLEDILRAQGEAFTAPLSADATTMLHGLGRVLLRAGVFVPL